MPDSYQLADPVQHWVNDLLADGVVTTSIVICGILFPSDELLWVEELPVWTISDLIWKGINHIVKAETTRLCSAGTSLPQRGSCSQIVEAHPSASVR